MVVLDSGSGHQVVDVGVHTDVDCSFTGPAVYIYMTS